MRNIASFALLVLLASCNNSNSSNNADKKTDSATTKTNNTTASSSKKFTSACDVLTLADVKRIFDLQLDDNYVPSTENYANVLRCEYNEQGKYVADPFKQKKITIDIQGGEDLNRWLKTARNAGKDKKNFDMLFFPAAGDSAFYSYYEMDMAFHSLSTEFAFTLNGQVITIYGNQVPKEEFYGKVAELYNTIKSK